MRIRQIDAEGEEIRFRLDEPVRAQRIRLSAYLPALGEEAEVYTAGMSVDGDSFSIPRRLGGEDGLTLFYVAADENGEVPGVKYASPASSVRAHAPLAPGSCKGLAVEDGMAESALALGARQAALNVNLGDFLLPYPQGSDTLFYRYGGRDWYIRAGAVRALEEALRPLSAAGVPVILTLVNAPVWRWEVQGAFWEKIRHPAYDGESGEASLFDTVRGGGCRAFAAFVSFLAERYAREDAVCGRMDGMAIGYSVNCSGEWANCGPCALPEFVQQYTAALRLTYQCAASVWKNIRIYAAVGQCAGGAPDASRREFSGAALLDGIERLCAEEGDFPWRAICQVSPGELLDGEPPVSGAAGERCGNGVRRMLLSVQGFPTDGTPAGDERQAQEYLRTYHTVSAMPRVDGLIYESHTDHAEEGALLGLLRRGEDGRCSERAAARVFRSLP